jgi:hypothetical protein
VARFDDRLRSRDFRGWKDDRLRSVTGADGADINSPCWPCFVLRRAGGDDVGWGLSRIGLPDNIGSFVCVCRHLGGAHVIADTPMTESLSKAGVILHALAKYFAFCSCNESLTRKYWHESPKSCR